ncbi:MAG: hypothetical protein AAGB51_11195 [Planctomycetota bacterium]
MITSLTPFAAALAVSVALCQQPTPPPDQPEPAAPADPAPTLLELSAAWQPLTAQEREAVLSRAFDPTGDLATRVAGALAAGRIGSLPEAERLFGLAVDPETDPTLAGAAYEALALLSGRPELARDAEAWAEWLGEARAWPAERWEEIRIERALAAASREWSRAEQAERLAAEASRRLFVASEPARRPELLAELLASPLPRVRTLGLDLASRELAEARPIGDGAAAIAIRSLDAADPAIRVRFASLLDASGRDDAIAALRTRLEVETEPTVADAVLRAAARRPDASTAGPSLIWFERADVTLPAAAVSVLAHGRAGLLGEADLERVRATLATKGFGALTTETVALTVFSADGAWLASVEPMLIHPEADIANAAARAIAGRLVTEARLGDLRSLVERPEFGNEVIVTLQAALDATEPEVIADADSETAADSIPPTADDAGVVTQDEPKPEESDG